MGRTRHNFSLDPTTVQMLKEVDNKSEFVDKAVSFYFANKNNKPIEKKAISSFNVTEIET